MTEIDTMKKTISNSNRQIDNNITNNICTQTSN